MAVGVHDIDLTVRMPAFSSVLHGTGIDGVGARSGVWGNRRKIAMVAGNVPRITAGPDRLRSAQGMLAAVKKTEPPRQPS